jgi:hypothetical protein
VKYVHLKIVPEEQYILFFDPAREALQKFLAEGTGFQTPIPCGKSGII